MVSVAVLGCGPGGMSFCHAVETLRRRRRQAALAAAAGTEKEEPAGADLTVTCFEKSSSPGGVWRAANPASEKETVNMYAALWTNGSSHGTEYFDYTYDEHFKRPVTVYMPRNEVLGYMIGRVTKNCPDFFEKYVEFNTEVVHVAYNEAQSRFDISVRHKDDSNDIVVRHFDKCIWACGENSRQHIPKSLLQMFQDGGFKGRLIHSADTANLKEDVQGKRILLVGGGYSAEDLALQAIKLGVEKVYISTRSSDSYVCSTESWPLDKVEILKYQALDSVSENGQCIHFTETEFQWPDKYVPDDEISTTIRDIDTVIFCTGYNVNLDMLDDNLNKGYPKWEFERELTVPATWKMPENHAFQDILGNDVETGKVLYNSGYTHPDLYHGVLISNPNMMFISIYESDYPLLATDASAWALHGFLTGRIPVPSQEEMRQENAKLALHQLALPYLRYYMDSNFNERVDAVWDDENPDFSKAWSAACKEYYEYTVKLLAHELEFAQYPVNIGNLDELNEKGSALVKFNALSSGHRYILTKDYMKENQMKTFRDCNDPDKFYSIFTGTKAHGLPKLWLDIELGNEPSPVEEKKV